MAGKSIIIIGAGMGGLAAGVYGQMNGFQTDIFEAHRLPGGQCCSWERKGYIFDGCIHHLFGCNETSRLYELWTELGAMPRDFVSPAEVTAVSSADGKLFRDYYDADLLEEHLMQLAPGDAGSIRDYLKGVRNSVRVDFMGELMMGSKFGLIPQIPNLLSIAKYFRPTMGQYAEKFSDPFLRRAFPLLVYSAPDIPMIVHLSRHGLGATGALKWPVGGARRFAGSIASRYEQLGGRIHYRQQVEEILVKDDRAIGVRLEDGSEHKADVVISNADGRKTIMEMLRGRYTDATIRRECTEPADETNWAVHVFLGVNRDLSSEPSALVMLLDRPVTIAGHTASSLEMQMYGMDPAMAPQGKGVIKVELVSSYKYWKALAADPARYEEEKEHVTDQVLDLLEQRFPGLRGQVEAVDVPTLLTWERYMGGTHGFANMPNRKVSIVGSLAGKPRTTLPGLDDFHLVGVWTTMAGALFANALSGRFVISELCRREGLRFATTAA